MIIPVFFDPLPGVGPDGLFNDTRVGVLPPLGGIATGLHSWSVLAVLAAAGKTTDVMIGDFWARPTSVGYMAKTTE